MKKPKKDTDYATPRTDRERRVYREAYNAGYNQGFTEGQQKMAEQLRSLLGVPSTSHTHSCDFF